MARLATQNLAANGFADIRIACASVENWRPDGAYDHAFANPPWHRQASTPSPDASRRGAKIAASTTLKVWVAFLASALRHRGTLSLILPAGLFGEASHALTEANCGEIALKPLWPRESSDAKLVILQGIKNGRGPCRVLAGLHLHSEGGGYTPEADRILREAAALPM
jgi:tRNA1(Val) A37 N6-methylase TrmN6